MTAASLIFPAIDGSRFQSRLAGCQDSLKQLGLALNQYGDQQQTARWRLANNGRLTSAGLFAAGLLPAGYLSDIRRAVCPDAWLAAQGVHPSFLPVANRLGVQLAPESQFGDVRVVNDQYDNWPGTWRNGTTNRWRFPPSLAEVPLLADAPSADLPGQSFSSHDGRGRNVLFEDGHIGFVPNAVPTGSSGRILAGDDAFAGSGLSVPLVFVSGH